MSSDADQSRVRPAEALRRLHEALPAWVNFTISRSDRGADHDWAVVVQVPDPTSQIDRYSGESRGRDLGAAVEEALDGFRKWAGIVRPRKLTAPGPADRRGEEDRQKDAS